MPKISQNILIALVLSSALVGCGTADSNRAAELIASHNYAGALEALKEADTTDASVARMKAIASFVEQKPAESFRQIALSRKLDPDNNPALAAMFFRTAKAVVREKERALEATALLDSAITLDPGLRNDAVELAWNRGIEYLALSGETGYGLMKFAVRVDEEALKRLRTRDLVAARRFDEYSAVEKDLALLQTAAISFRQTNGRVPATTTELSAAFPGSPIGGRSGWIYKFTDNGPRIAVEASADHGNPYTIPVGSTIKVW